MGCLKERTVTRQQAQTKVTSCECGVEVTLLGVEAETALYGRDMFGGNISAFVDGATGTHLDAKCCFTAQALANIETTEDRPACDCCFSKCED